MRLGVEAALVDGRLVPGDVEIAGGTVAARWSMAELRLVRVVMPSLLSRPIIEVGFWWWPAHLPGNSQRWSARVLAAPNGFAIGSDVTSASRGGGSRSGSAPSRR